MTNTLAYCEISQIMDKRSNMFSLINFHVKELPYEANPAVARFVFFCDELPVCETQKVLNINK
jgi:hypothetical protein